MSKGQNILHVHTMYSLYDSACSPDEMVARAKEMGCTNLTLTDHRTLLGVEPFMDAGKKYGINAIPGIEADLEGREHLLIVPFDYKGFQSISFAARDSNLHIEKVGKKVKIPIMENWVIEKYFKNNSHVFATTACIQGPIAQILLRGHKIKQSNEKVKAQMETLKPFCMEWKSVHQEYLSLVDQINTLDTERKEYAKLITKNKQKQLNALQKKIPKDLNHPEYKKAENDYNFAVSCFENAAKQHEILKSMIDDLRKKRKETKDKLDKLKTKKERYQKYKEEIQTLPDPEDLYAEAKEKLFYLKSIFSNLFIELQYHGLEWEAYVMPILAKLAKETDTPLIVGNDAHMKDGSAESIEARRIVRFNYFETSQTVSEADKTLYLKTDEELYQMLSQVVDEDSAREAIRNTQILESCHVVFPQETHYPAIRTGPSFDELLETAKQEKIRLREWDDVHEKRLYHEIDVIKSMGYVDYFMVVRDFCRMGRKLGCIPKSELKNIPEDFSKIDDWLKLKNFHTGVGIGPGRGSGAGSLVCYLLGITNLDPIKYNLLFERFLNPERVSMPDIDTDIKSSLRPTIIRYFKWKYGEKAVCSIVTMTTWGAKGAIQMAGRERSRQIYNTKDTKGTIKKRLEQKQKEYYKKTLEMSDCVPETPGTKLSDVEAVLKAKFGGDEESMLILSRAKLLEGKLCGTGIHAGGVVISDNDNINEYVPLAWNNEKQVWAAQCDMIRLEEKGMLKFDLLGLNTLDVTSDATQMVERYRGIIIDLDQIEFEPEVFENIYAKGFTNSVFQFESSGMKSMLIDFKPTCFEDIILLVAAYRPGPMQYLSNIIRVKHGEPVTYLTPQLEDILSMTYGATIYQEQVMLIFQKLAGYSLGGADLVRRAMSKKKLEKLKIERQAFVHGDQSRNIKGCVANGIDEEIANRIFDEIMDFAKYAFNKCSTRSGLK